ncbi:MAG: hypothetical protein Q8O23_01660 [Gallionella sp.]|nr:hypothetical protein [Gallionella sp.]
MVEVALQISQDNKAQVELRMREGRVVGRMGRAQPKPIISILDSPPEVPVAAGIDGFRLRLYPSYGAVVVRPWVLVQTA